MIGATARLSHEQATALMPSFIRGRLDSQRQRQLQEHIAACPACAAVHRADLELAGLLELAPPGAEELLTSARMERNRRQLLEAIDAGARSCEERAEQPAGLRSRRTVPAWAALAAGLATLLVGGTLALQLLPPGGGRGVVYQTRTASPAPTPAAAGPLYRVVFRPTATQGSIQALLQAQGAVVVGGPSASGVYTLAFPATTATEEEILGNLRRQPDILLAEKAVHRDG